MSTITVSLPEEDLAFLTAYSQAQGTTAEAFLARQVHLLRINLEKPLHRDVVAATGIISSDANRDNHRKHLEGKHE